MKKIAAVLLGIILVPSAQALKIVPESGGTMIGGIQKLQLNVAKEYQAFGEVDAACLLADKRGREIDTVSIIINKARVPVYFEGDYNSVVRVTCQFDKAMRP